MKRSRSGKKEFVVVCSYVVCLSLLLTLFLTSGAKYYFGVDGYTNFTVSEFNAAIFDDADEESVKAGSSGVKPIGQGDAHFMELKDCFPGMDPRDYPFLITNGTDAKSFASVDIAFSVKVRTLRNIPLHYTLVYHGADEGGEPIELAYECCREPKQLARTTTYGGGNDAVWYEYHFTSEDSDTTGEPESTVN